jgi:Flp pilus assembly protein TadD
MSDVDFRLAHGLNAVLGWIELGNTKEARAELESLPSEFHSEPNVLDLKWILHAREKNWEAALEVAEKLVEIAPESAAGWLHRAYALRRTANGGLARAADVLRPAFERFPKEPVIPFNLACYACQSGNLDEARAWLREAFQRQEKGEIKAMALADPDLEQLWPEIKTW